MIALRSASPIGVMEFDMVECDHLIQENRSGKNCWTNKTQHKTYKE